MMRLSGTPSSHSRIGIGGSFLCYRTGAVVERDRCGPRACEPDRASCRLRPRPARRRALPPASRPRATARISQRLCVLPSAACFAWRLLPRRGARLRPVAIPCGRQQPVPDRSVGRGPLGAGLEAAAEDAARFGARQVDIARGWPRPLRAEELVDIGLNQRALRGVRACDRRSRARPAEAAPRMLLVADAGTIAGPGLRRGLGFFAMHLRVS